jgi:nucleoid-associated protein YgaU
MTSDRLTRAVIVEEATRRRVTVMFNPDEYRLEQGNNYAEVAVPGLPAPPAQYVRGRARTLSMDLLFDTDQLGGADVRRSVQEILQLLEPTAVTMAPPVLFFVMGSFTFRCVLVEAAQRYTVFRPDGTSTRAILSVRFQEQVSIDIEIRRGLFVGPPVLHNLAGGETLDALAARYLGDAARWREIARANGIVDPLTLVPGAALVIPGASR